MPQAAELLKVSIIIHTIWKNTRGFCINIAKILGKGVTVNQVHRMRANAYRTLYHDPKLRAHYENEYKRQEQEYSLLVEQTIIPLILSASTLEREMQVLETIPIEEISI